MPRVSRWGLAVMTAMRRRCGGIWRRLRAEMEQLHGEPPARDSGGVSQPRPGLNPDAATFSFGASASSVVPSPVHAGDEDDGWAAGGDDSHGEGSGPGDALDGRHGGSGRPGAGLCPQHRATGECARGAACPHVHGDLCEVPILFSLLDIDTLGNYCIAP